MEQKRLILLADAGDISFFTTTIEIAARKQLLP